MLLVEDIISVINSLPLKEALVYLVTKGITDWSSKSYDKIKEIIKEKQNEGKYAFVPSKEEVLFLEQAEKESDYQQILILVPNYKYIDLIRTGLLLKEYNRRIDNGEESEKNKQNITRIKMDIIRRPGGGRLLKIAKLPSSKFFSIILSYLYELKIHGYPENQLEEEFNDLVDEWEKCTHFIDNETTIENIIDFCKKMIEDNNPRFFMMALYENQIFLVEEALKKIDQEQILKANNYLAKVEKEEKPRATPKIEIMIFKNPKEL